MRFKTIGLSLIATCAITGFIAGAAQASGPVWWEAGSKALAANTIIETLGNLTNLKFKTSPVTLVCNRASRVSSSSGAVFKGNPGTDKVEIEYSECAAEGNPNCVTKPIKEETLSLLAYPTGGTNGGKAVDAFFPETANVMLEFKLENKSATETCVDNGTTVEFKAVGTEIAIPIIGEKRKCGTIAKLGIVETGAFKETKGGEIGKKGALRLPEPAITAAEYWNPTGAGKFEALACKTEAIVTEPCKESTSVAEEIGDVSFALKEEKEIGWEV
jgi:hypothetical protein